LNSSFAEQHLIDRDSYFFEKLSRLKNLACHAVVLTKAGSSLVAAFDSAAAAKIQENK
jgi:hypothetical protein